MCLVTESGVSGMLESSLGITIGQQAALLRRPDESKVCRFPTIRPSTAPLPVTTSAPAPVALI